MTFHAKIVCPDGENSSVIRHPFYILDQNPEKRAGIDRSKEYLD